MRSKLTPKKAVGIAAVGLLVSGFAIGAALAGGQHDQSNLYVEAYNQNNLIRFHVIANSDSVRDQALKRRVRDLIVLHMNPKFSEANNVKDARRIAKNNLIQMEEIAQKEVHRWGEQYGAKAVMGRYTFPAKTYGNVTLPGGQYEAVRIILGDGTGSNWWCVLFPPLCFISGSKEMPVETLASEKHSAVPIEQSESNQASSGYRETEVKVKFKMLELLQEKF